MKEITMQFPKLWYKTINFLLIYPFIYTCIQFPVDRFEDLSVWQEEVDPGARAGLECQAWV